jgi:hypothetical protein
MFGQLDKIEAIFLVVVIPLAWGLGVEFIFELLRRWGTLRKQEDESAV